MGFDYERYKRVKQPHGKLFIRNIWTLQSWPQRFMFISMVIFITTISASGWIIMLHK